MFRLKKNICEFFIRNMDNNMKCYSSHVFNGTTLKVYYGNYNSCHPCTSPPQLAAKTISELLQRDACGGGMVEYFHPKNRL